MNVKAPFAAEQDQDAGFPGRLTRGARLRSTRTAVRSGSDSGGSDRRRIGHKPSVRRGRPSGQQVPGGRWARCNESGRPRSKLTRVVDSPATRQP